MIKEPADKAEQLHIHFPPSTTLREAVNVVQDIEWRVRRAQGMVKVCTAAMIDEELDERSLFHALTLLHDYLAALSDGMEDWFVRMLPVVLKPPVVHETDA